MHILIKYKSVVLLFGIFVDMQFIFTVTCFVSVLSIEWEFITDRGLPSSIPVMAEMRVDDIEMCRLNCVEQVEGVTAAVYITYWVRCRP